MNQQFMRSLLDLMGGSTQLSSTARSARQTLFTESYQLPIDTVVDDNCVYIYIEIPGVRKEDMKIDVLNNKLTVCVEKTRSYDEPTVSELFYGHLERVISLPFCVTKPETVTSTYKDGVLKIKVNRLLEESNRFVIQPN